MISVVCWKWGDKFGPEYVNNLYSMLQRHLHLPHKLICVTDNPWGISDHVKTIRMPDRHAGTIRCRRRLWHFARERVVELGYRILALDLDCVALDTLDSLFDRTEPAVFWYVGYAKVYTGAMVLFDAGALHNLWENFDCDPEGYPQLTGERNASETAMLTYWLRRSTMYSIGTWTEQKDKIVMWFGAGYERLEHWGIGPSNPNPPPGTRLVMLGGDDKYLLDEKKYDWVKENWR